MCVTLVQNVGDKIYSYFRTQQKSGQMRAKLFDIVLVFNIKKDIGSVWYGKST